MGIRPWLSALNKSTSPSSGETRGNISCRHARPPSRFACPLFSFLALEPHRINRSPWFSINQCTSSNSPGTFCTSSRMIGRLSASGSLARSCSRSNDGRFENSNTRSVFRKSNTILSANAVFRYVDFPVFLGPQRNADWPSGSVSSSIRRMSEIGIAPVLV